MLRIEDLSKSYNAHPVLNHINLEIVAGEIICLLGPSGCGKTTLLRLIAGLEQPDSGVIYANNQLLNDVPPHQRGVGLMFQDFALFPHLNVAENVAFGLRMRKLRPEERAQRVQEVLSLVGLSGFASRDVAQLSGGERQRVALARSLAPSPKLLMLDEPLGSLDAALREHLVLELRDIIKQLGLTAIYVTHDQSEAYAIADRIVVMQQGHIEQIGTAEELYWSPKTTFVARFLGLSNLVNINNIENGFARTPLGDFPVKGNPRTLLLHPARLSLSQSGLFTAQVTNHLFLGMNYRLYLRHESGIELIMYLPAQIDIPKIGQSITLDLPEDAIIPLK